MIGPILSGRKVVLRPLRDDDLPRRVAWLNDAETYRLLAGSPSSRVFALSDAERWRRVLEADAGAVVFAIESALSGTHIGDIDLHSIDRYLNAAKLTVLIGEKAYWSRGYGTDAIAVLLRYAFSDLHLDKVLLRVYAFNDRAIRCYEKCGFKRTGKSSDDPWINTGPGEIYMTACREDFEQELAA